MRKLLGLGHEIKGLKFHKLSFKQQLNIIIYNIIYTYHNFTSYFVTVITELNYFSDCSAVCSHQKTTSRFKVHQLIATHS